MRTLFWLLVAVVGCGGSVSSGGVEGGGDNDPKYAQEDDPDPIGINEVPDLTLPHLNPLPDEGPSSEVPKEEPMADAGPDPEVPSDSPEFPSDSGPLPEEPPPVVCEPPLPIALNEDGSQGAFTSDGRQLCGQITDNCGALYLFGSCPGDSLCGGENLLPELADGSMNQERFVCAECRESDDPPIVEACAARGLRAFIGCRAGFRNSCQPLLDVQGSDPDVFRLYQCCT